MDPSLSTTESGANPRAASRDARDADCAKPSRETLDRIRRVFVESLGLNLRPKDLPYESKLDEAVGLDSIAALEFVTALEEEFGFEIEPEFLEIDFLRDLPRLASYLEDAGRGRAARQT
jgi:acyl carrier protein